MNAGEIVTNLLKAGRGLSDALRDAKKTNAGVSLPDFIKSDAGKEVLKKVEDLLKGLNTGSIQAAIKESADKRFKLLKGRTVFELSDAEASQYDALIQTEDKLFDELNSKLQNRDAFYTWLLEDGLDLLKKVATIVVPLLL